MMPTSASAIFLLGLVLAAGTALAQLPAPSRPAPKPAAEQGVHWSDLKPAQQATLRPLQSEWTVISSPHKQKWLELAARFPKMTPAAQERIQQRMSEWAKLTPQQRSEARLHFQEAKELPATDRQARWTAYQALPPERKRELAERAAPAASVATPPEGVRRAAGPGARGDKPARSDVPQAKSNIVPNPALAAPPKIVAPSIVQARPGASTTLITRRPTPPAHQQTGLPKIAATPEFVDKATLLPQRGPQGAAATRSAAVAASGPATARQ